MVVHVGDAVIYQYHQRILSKKTTARAPASLVYPSPLAKAPLEPAARTFFWGQLLVVWNDFCGT